MRRTARDTDESSRRINRRALFMGGCMTAMVAVLGARMRYLGVEQADQFRLLAEENRINIRLIPPARGLILDRNGKPVAANEQNYRIVITREGAGDVDRVLNRLSHVISMTQDAMDRAKKDIARNSKFVPVTVADRLSWDDFSRVALNAPALPGVMPEVGLSRIYPRDADFAHVVGYVGPVSEKDLASLENPDPLLTIPKFQIGKIGVERWMEDDLRGAAGNSRIEVNSVGRVMRELERTEGKPGKDLRLTIDADVQNFVQARLGDESAACVVMDVDNGDIIAAASSPSFDPNLFVRGISNLDYSILTSNDHRPLANKVVQGVYPPGSTFKMMTALAALEAGVIDLDTRISCRGFIEMGSRKAHCWKRGGHGTVDLTRSLAESCDVFYYEVALKVGIDKIAAMCKRFGLGQRYDLPMSAISEGTIPNKDWMLEKHGQDWRMGDTINAAIGQGYVLASPLQLAVMVARIASGKVVLPRLMRSVGGKDVALAAAAPIGLDGSLLRAVRGGMFEVINNQRGTAYSARIADETMLWAGKSGTSQVRNISAAERETGVVGNDALPWKRRDHALFVGFAPAEAPRYSVAVVVEHGGGGSSVAAPIARDAILRTLYGKVPPVAAYPESQRARMETLLNALPLRLPDGTPPARIRA